MNRYQKAESRRIKAWQHLFQASGYDFNYRQVKRKIRSLDRAFARIRSTPKYMRKAFKRADFLAKKFHFKKES